MSYTFAGSVTLGSPQALTEGSPNLDFAISGGGTCTTGTSYVAGNSCTVNVTFAPQYPGFRKGAVLLKDNAGNIITTAYLRGTGTGPLLRTFTGRNLPVTETALGGGFSQESGIQASLKAHLLAVVNDHREIPVWRKHWTPAIQALPARRFGSINWVVTAVLLLVALLAAFNQPVFAAVGRWMGFGYLPETGFFKLVDTQLIKGPVMQQKEDGTSLSVEKGIATLTNTRLWVQLTAPWSGLEGVWLSLPDGSRLAALTWSQGTSSTQREVTFGVLPARTSSTSLHMADGWQIPLEWVAATQAGLASTEVSLPPKSTPAGPANRSLCLTAQQQAQICVGAGIVDQDGIHLLVVGEAISPAGHFTWDPAMTTMGFQLIDGRQQIHGLTGPVEVDQTRLSMLFNGDTQPSEVTILRLSGLAFRITGALGKETTVTLQGPINLAFHLPDRQASLAPTPWVMNNPKPPYLATTPTP